MFKKKTCGRIQEGKWQKLFVRKVGGLNLNISRRLQKKLLDYFYPGVSNIFYTA